MKLTPTQKIILTDIIAGFRYKEIAIRHHLSMSHIKKTITAAVMNNGFKTVTQLAVNFSHEGAKSK